MAGARGPVGKDDGAKLSYKAGKPKMPRGLTVDGIQIFDTACRFLKAAGVLQVVDGAAVGQYAQWLSLWQTEVQKLNVEGCVTKNMRGEDMKNPRLTAVKDISTMLAAAEKKLGFSPEDRMRIKGTGDKKQSRLGALQGRVAKKAAKKVAKT